MNMPLTPAAARLRLALIGAAAGARDPVVLAGAGAGLVAQALCAGGVDALAVWASSVHRTAGRPSLSAILPHTDADALVDARLPEILAAAGRTPVIRGVVPTSPRLRDHLAGAASLGLAGVHAFPSAAMVNGTLRQDLEWSGLGYDRDLDLIEAAHRMGLLTLLQATCAQEVRRARNAGADVVLLHLGVTRPGGIANTDAARRAMAVLDAADGIPVLVHGGPLRTAADHAALLRAVPGLAGVATGSLLDAEPIRAAVAAASSALRRMLTGRPADLDPIRLLDEQTLPAYLGERGLIAPDADDVTVRSLGGGISNVVLWFRAGPVTGVAKQPRARIRVRQEWICSPDRNHVEADAIATWTARLPAAGLPRLLDRDPANHVFVMSDVGAQRPTWKTDLLAGVVDQEVVLAVTHLLADLHRATWDDATLAARFTDDELLRQVRLDPYYAVTATAHPDLATQITSAARRLVEHRRCLVHGDFVPKNIVVGGPITLVDFEISHWGNPAYDVASLLNHLMLKATARPASADQLHTAAHTVWRTYKACAPHNPDLDDDTVAHLGALALARVDGHSPVEYLQEPGRALVRRYGRELLADPPLDVPEALDRIRKHLASTTPPATRPNPGGKQ